MRRSRGTVPTLLLVLSISAVFLYVGFLRPDGPPPEPEPEQPTGNAPIPEPQPEPEPPPPDEASQAWERARDQAQSHAWGEIRTPVAAALGYEQPHDRLRQLLEWGNQANEQLMFGHEPSADIVTYRVRQGENLSIIAGRHRISVGAIKFVNGMEGDMLRAEQVLRIPTGTFSILAVKREFRLYVLYEGAPFQSYPIAIGAEDATPRGEYTVGPKTSNPHWNPPLNVQRDRDLPPLVPYGDPRNPLGTRWITLLHPRHQGLGIHGTNDDGVIGTAVTLGCIRLHNEDVERVYDLVTEGMRVVIRD